jgi:hypothetical protein
MHALDAEQQQAAASFRGSEICPVEQQHALARLEPFNEWGGMQPDGENLILIGCAAR